MHLEADWPAPEVPRRHARMEEVPASCKRAWRAALEEGWAVSVSWARGTAPDRWWNPGQVVDLVTFIAQKPGHGVLFASWEDGLYRTGRILGGDRLGAKELPAVLRGERDQ